MDNGPSFRGRRVLVMGGTGFLGGRVVERLVLEHGAQVTVLARDFSRAMRVARFGSVRIVLGDFGDRASLTRAAEGCDYVINCAHDMAGTFTRHNRRANVQGDNQRT